MPQDHNGPMKMRMPRHDLDDSTFDDAGEQVEAPSQLVAMCVIFIPLAMWLCLCLFGEQGLVNWCRYGRKHTNQNYLQNRMR